MSVTQAIEAVYESLIKDNENINECIADLKAALKAEGLKEATLDAERLVQNNREGRKRLQAYFKKRGVVVSFKV